jgi:hypothetical protein
MSKKNPVDPTQQNFVTRVVVFQVIFVTRVTVLFALWKGRVLTPSGNTAHVGPLRSKEPPFQWQSLSAR